MPPRLSIVIPSYSRADLLELCLASVARFAPALTEVIVVDDCSRDAAISRAALAFPNVRVHRLPKRSGFCVAANAGIALATAPVVEMLNDDTEVTAGWADAALHWFDHPRVAAVAPLVLQNDPDRRARRLPPLIDSAGDEYDAGGFARKRCHGEQWPVASGRWPDKDEDKTPAVGDRESNRGGSELATGHWPPATAVWGASASAAFYRREALVAAGGFPADFGAYFEDVDLSFRLRRLGCDIWFDPASVVWHRVSASYGKTPKRAVLERQSCNEERVFWRNTTGRERLRRLPRHAAVLFGKALRRAQDGTLAPWTTGRIRAWVGG